MLDKLEQYLNFQQIAMRTFSKRQEILAMNIANADTPKYQSRDVDFEKILKKSLKSLDQDVKNCTMNLNVTSKKHLNKKNSGYFFEKILYRTPDQPSADKNTVDMNRERINFLDNSIRYYTSITITNSYIKNMMSVLYKG
ncbi:MAG: flagellar basal body rod protein FlgB [Wigglesworthia glossinidia]|nr:flagellar basal body rod protein FlgB [Wigglesworthia glossinidia]